MLDVVVEDQLGNEIAHTRRVCSGGACVEAAELVAAHHGLLVLVLAVVAAILRQRANVVAGRVEHWPAQVAESLYPIEIGEEAGRLFPVAVRKLALVASYRPEHGLAVS